MNSLRNQIALLLVVISLMMQAHVPYCLAQGEKSEAVESNLSAEPKQGDLRVPLTAVSLHDALRFSTTESTLMISGALNLLISKTGQGIREDEIVFFITGGDGIWCFLRVNSGENAVKVIKGAETKLTNPEELPAYLADLPVREYHSTLREAVGLFVKSGKWLAESPRPSTVGGLEEVEPEFKVYLCTRDSIAVLITWVDGTFVGDFLTLAVVMAHEKPQIWSSPEGAEFIKRASANLNKSFGSRDSLALSSYLQVPLGSGERIWEYVGGHSKPYFMGALEAEKGMHFIRNHFNRQAEGDPFHTSE